MPVARGTCGVINDLEMTNDQIQRRTSQIVPQYTQFNQQFSPQFYPPPPQFNNFPQQSANSISSSKDNSINLFSSNSVNPASQPEIVQINSPSRQLFPNDDNLKRVIDEIYEKTQSS